MKIRDVSEAIAVENHSHDLSYMKQKDEDQRRVIGRL